jgi:hypothetical protein
MNDFDPLQEPPPMPRFKALPPTPPKAGRVSWRRRASAKRPDVESGRGGPRSVPKGPALALAALVVIGLQAWTLHRLARVRSDLSVAAASLEEARTSLGMLWETATRLDEDQISGLAVLSDSIRSVFAYAQGEIRLWETAYYAQERRLDENAAWIGTNAEAIARMTTGMRAANTRIDALAGADERTATRLDALVRQDRAHGTALESLAQRAQTQESAARDVTTTLATLRQTLAGLDAALLGFDDRLSASSSAFGRMDTRVDGLTGWVDGFRRVGLSGEAVADRLSALTDELRRVRLRVDSIRPVRTTLRTAEREP